MRTDNPVTRNRLRAVMNGRRRKVRFENAQPSASISCGHQPILDTGGHWFRYEAKRAQQHEIRVGFGSFRCEVSEWTPGPSVRSTGYALPAASALIRIKVSAV